MSKATLMSTAPTATSTWRNAGKVREAAAKGLSRLAGTPKARPEVFLRLKLEHPITAPVGRRVTPDDIKQ
jgi:hypothetical protein